MPIFEYYCTNCGASFETLRPSPEADKPATCPTCQAVSTQRILSLFASSVKTDAAAMPALAGGGCCGGGQCGCHA